MKSNFASPRRILAMALVATALIGGPLTLKAHGVEPEPIQAPAPDPPSSGGGVGIGTIILIILSIPIY